MPRFVYAVAAMIMVAAAAMLSGPRASDAPPSDREILYYRNPMGLPDVSPVPKKDSMGMDYIPVYADETGQTDGSIALSPEKIQRAGVRTEAVERRALSRRVRGAGMVMPDEGRLSVVSAKFKGFIEELLVPVSGVTIRAGQPLVKVWIESPDILAKQADYLSALGASNRSAVAVAEQNLRQFGVPPEVIAQIRESKTPARSITLNAPISGTVIEKPAIVGMGFAGGETLYKIADLNEVWVIVEIAEQDLGLIREGQTAALTFPALPGETLTAAVEFIYPEIDGRTRTGKARLVVPNAQQRLKLGYYAHAEIEAPISADPVIAAPVSSVMDDGTRQIVFVAGDGGRFTPTPVTLGARGGEYIEIRDGLKPGDRVVVRGNFLIDAESNLRAALAAFSKPGAEP